MIARAEAVLTVSQQLPRRFEQLLRNERSRGERTEEAGRSRKGKIWRDEDGDDIPAKKRLPLISHQGTGDDFEVCFGMKGFGKGRGRVTERVNNMLKC